MTANSRILQFFMPEASIASKTAMETMAKAEDELDEHGPLGRCLESLFPDGRLEWIGTATDSELDAYAGKFGVTGRAMVEAIFSPEWNKVYLNWKRTHEKGDL